MYRGSIRGAFYKIVQTLSIHFLFVLINQLHQLLSLQSRSCLHLTARNDWNNSKVIRPFCANGQNQNSPKNIKGQFFLSSSFVSRVAPTLPKNSTSNFQDLFLANRFKKPSTLVKCWWWQKICLNNNFVASAERPHSFAIFWLMLKHTANACEARRRA